MSEVFAEYFPIGLADPLRQGDVLERIETGATPWNRHLLVITADCDFAYDKHQGRVTCVPLMTKDEYLLELQIPQIRQELAEKLVGALRTELARLGLPVPSEPRCHEWLSEESLEGILAALGTELGAAPPLESAVRGFKAIKMASPSLVGAFESLQSAQAELPNAKSAANYKAKLLAKMQSCFKQPPGDALFLSSIGQGHDFGYFAYLRHLEQVWQRDVALDISRKSVGYRRISRLRETYIHSIAQRFALVYMAIGLPNEYEAIRDLHAEYLEGDVT